jgi:hypothetical protein
MRSLVVVGFVASSAAPAGCGLDLGGAAIPSSASPDAQPTIDATSSLEGAVQGTDGGSDKRASSDGNVGEASATDAADETRGGADVAQSLDALATDSADDTLSASDGPAEAMADGGPSTGACVSAIPHGWSLVIYDLGADPCPANFASHDVSGPATIQAGACSCGCSVSQPGNCAQGTLIVHPSGGANSSCDADGGWSKALDGSACTVLGVTLYVQGPHSDLIVPLTAQGGTCSDTTQADSSKLVTTPTRYCEVPSPEADSICNGTVPSGFASCIQTSGATTCPSGSVFAHPYVVEDSATLQCPSCAGCTVATTCTNATLAGFSDMGCSAQGLIGSVGADGGCNSVNLASYPASLVAIEYSATASSTCTSGSSAPSAQLTNPRTICCR